ncbi:signal peptidase I [Leifsonia aquatica]|uniref:signal peptidase I n=1 Tax=Leifsonia aquatica TaxID=144185 RepID=UPI0038161B82
MTIGWRIYAVLRSTVLTGGAVLGGACIVIFAVGMFLGVKPAIVISGSMLPTIPVGAMTFSIDRPASQLEIGDAVMVDRPDGNGLITHRIVEMEKSGSRMSLTLQGDNNDVTDPEPYLVTKAAVVVFTVPALGYVADFLQRNGIYVGIVLVCLIAALMILDPAKLRRPRAPEDDETDDVDHDVDVPDDGDNATVAADEADAPTLRPRSGRRAPRKETTR